MKIDKTYTLDEIIQKGLIPNKIDNVDYKVYINGSKVFFFEPVDTENLRLYSIINKKSFFL